MSDFGRKRAVILAVWLSLIGGPAIACTVSTAPHLASAVEADLVFVGKFESFESFRWDMSYPGIPLPNGLYTFSVIDTLKGDAQPEWKIMWWVNAIGSNTRLYPEKPVIVFAMDGTDTIAALVQADVLERPFLDLIQYIIEEPVCSSAPIFENSPENRAALEALLSLTGEVSQ